MLRMVQVSRSIYEVVRGIEMATVEHRLEEEAHEASMMV
jgi:hypothetical protein